MATPPVISAPSFKSGESVGQFVDRFGKPMTRWGGADEGKQELGRDGMDWVGDLMLEAQIETSNEQQRNDARVGGGRR